MWNPSSQTRDQIRAPPPSTGSMESQQLDLQRSPWPRILKLRNGTLVQCDMNEITTLELSQGVPLS